MNFEEQAYLLYKIPDLKYASVSGMIHSAQQDLEWLKSKYGDQIRKDGLRKLIELLKDNQALGLTSENAYIRELTRLVNNKGL